MRIRHVIGGALPLLVLSIMAAPAEDAARVSGPVLGFVLERESAGVRPILGVPGAAVMGTAVGLGIDVERAAVFSRSEYVLAALAGTGQVALFTSLSAPAPLPIEGVAPAPDRIVLSPGGTAAALYYAGRNAIQVLAGLPGAPALRREIDLSVTPGPPSAMAVSDDGDSILVSSRAEQAEPVFLLRADGTAQYVMSAGRVSAAAFFNGSADAVFADSAGNAVYWVRDVAGEPAAIAIAGERDGIASPVAIQVSGDNRRVFVAGAEPGTVATIDLSGGPLSLVSCGCAPSALERLQGNAVFRLTGASSEPAWVFDGDAPEARVVFVPPATADQGGEQ